MSESTKSNKTKNERYSQTLTSSSRILAPFCTSSKSTFTSFSTAALMAPPTLPIRNWNLLLQCQGVFFASALTYPPDLIGVSRNSSFFGTVQAATRVQLKEREGGRYGVLGLRSYGTNTHCQTKPAMIWWIGNTKRGRGRRRNSSSSISQDRTPPEQNSHKPLIYFVCG